MRHEMSKEGIRVHEAAGKINHFCAVLYRYLYDLREDVKAKESFIKGKEGEIKALQKEIAESQAVINVAKNNLAETKEILNTRYKLDFEAMETEELL